MYKIVVIILAVLTLVLLWVFWFSERTSFHKAEYSFRSQKKGDALPPPPPRPTFKEQLSGWLDIAGKVSPLVSTTLAIMSWRKGRRKRR